MNVHVVATGREATLAQIAGGQPTLVVLMRHRDCPFCEIHMGRLLQRREQIGRIVVVSFQSAELLEDTAAALPFEIAVGVDTERALYRQLGAGNMGIPWFALRPSSWLAWAMHIGRGRPLRRDKADLKQLGADLILDANGDVVWSRVPTSPADRPAVELVIEQMDLARAVSRAA